MTALNWYAVYWQNLRTLKVSYYEVRQETPQDARDNAAEIFVKDQRSPKADFRVLDVIKLIK